jgi:hypothetical protein
MSFDLKRITKGRKKLPPRVLIYSFDGVGKTGFAAGSRKPFFVDANKGSHKYDVSRLDVSSWDETIEATEAVAAGEIECETLVWDAVTDLEAFSHAKLFPGSTVTDFKGGYGKGDDVVVSEWRRQLSLLERVWKGNKSIILIAHARVKKFEDPTGPGYERFEVACRPQLAGMLRQWVDYVFFAREEVVTAKANSGDRVKTATTGVRRIYTRRVPAYDAKARGTLLFPESLLLSWSEFEKAVEHDETNASRTVEMEKAISEMLAEIGDQALDTQVRQYLKDYPGMIVDAHNRVAARLDEFRKQANGNAESANAA